MSTDQARVPIFRLPGELPSVGWPMLVAIFVGAGCAAYIGVNMPELYRGALATIIGLNLIVLGMKWPRAAAIATLLFLPFVALIRRLLISESGWTANDPLLLVGPVVALFLFYRVYLVERRTRELDLLGKLVFALLVLIVVQAFNPLGQGGLVASLGGLIFLAVPLLWFFIGRELTDETLVRRLAYAAMVVAVVVGLYGVWQTELRPQANLPSWDQAWYEFAGDSASLRVGDDSNNTARAFSTFPSNGEYAAYLSIGLIFAGAMVLHRRLLPLLLIPPLALAIFYAGGRAVIALTGLALVVLTGIRTRNAAAAVVVIVLGIGTVYGLAATLGPRLDRAAGVSGDVVTERNVSGLLKPLDPGKSSFLARWDSMVEGIADGFRNPAGEGTAATNRAGANLSDEGYRITDNDVSNMFVGLGAVGGLLYLVIIFVTLRTVFRRYMQNSSWLLFGVAGVLIVMLGNWLSSGYYALAPLTWFLIGWATRPAEDELRDTEEASRRPLAAGARPLEAARSG